jgi:hypothetical protein
VIAAFVLQVQPQVMGHPTRWAAPLLATRALQHLVRGGNKAPGDDLLMVGPWEVHSAVICHVWVSVQAVYHDIDGAWRYQVYLLQGIAGGQSLLASLQS